MNKLEAAQALREGKRLTHPLFTPEEWVELLNRREYVYEDGVTHKITEFWDLRSGTPEWDENWRVFDEKSLPEVDEIKNNAIIAGVVCRQIDELMDHTDFVTYGCSLHASKKWVVNRVKRELEKLGYKVQYDSKNMVFRVKK